ncbi:OmpA family protein [Brevundimonas sp.]|uniref:OmpA family protein n=1 Tax=Brevundimonas sp. TaxID=1871086 RepID=UPI002ABC8AC6|nr:OmpA family protein [Brevundimonas sp.]MDZ4362018.1 OmpA family protein [Brevundimonas sp.]
MKRVLGLAAVLGLGAILAGCSGGMGMFGDRDALVAVPTTCTPKRFEVYFAEGEARLTPAAREAIGMTAAQLQGCDIRAVQVLGLADASGGSSANQSLSERRAVAVAEALQGAGWPTPAFDVTAVGDEGAVTAEGTQEPMRRRTEVLVEAMPPR